MAFPHDVTPELRRWISACGTSVMKTWLELHDRSKPKGLRERLDRKAYEERLKREGLSAWAEPDEITGDADASEARTPRCGVPCRDRSSGR